MEFLSDFGFLLFCLQVLFYSQVTMSTESILGIGILVFSINLIGVYIFLRIKFEQWNEEDK